MPQPQSLNRQKTFQSLPSQWQDDPLPQIQTLLAKRQRHKLIVLDDDPTGTQTVTNIPVVTDWTVETLLGELVGPEAGFFILTNSRSLTFDETQSLHHEIGENIRKAVSKTGVTITLVSRSDSTLRGHYPLETDTMAEELEKPDLLILAPYFEAGGRYTINDVHYVAEGDVLVPAAETAFAKDKAFGYENSHLPSWVQEKSNGNISTSQVASISIEQLRLGGPEAIREYLIGLPKGKVCIANSACPRDIEVLALATLGIESAGRSVVFRSAASVVAALLGQRPGPPLAADRLARNDTSNGGLVIVGSYVPKTTAQIEHLLSNANVEPIVLSIDQILSPEHGPKRVQEISDQVNKVLKSGKDVVVFTSRELVVGSDASSSLAIGRKVSDALVAIAQNLKESPRYLIAKGGITSSDIATLGLKIRRALVVGQAIPGVPVWQLGEETPFPGMNYVVFPGNVGSEKALGDLVSTLQKQATKTASQQ